MAKYTDDELAAAGRQLAGAIGAIGGRLDALESAPNLERMTNTWSEGQDYARSRGYSAAELAELEKYMVERGVSHHADAIRLFDLARKSVLRRPGRRRDPAVDGRRRGGFPAAGGPARISGWPDEVVRSPVGGGPAASPAFDEAQLRAELREFLNPGHPAVPPSPVALPVPAADSGAAGAEMLIAAATALSGLGARLDALESSRAAGRGRARAAGYTDEGLGELEKFMRQHGVADHEIAIPAFERANPPPEPIVSGNQSWNFLGSPGEAAPNLNMLYDGDEEGFLRQAVPAALVSVRNQR